MLTQPHVLLVGTDEVEAMAIQSLLCEHATVRCARTPLELYRSMNQRFDAILYSRSFEAGPWSSGLQQIGQAFPDLPVIVLGRAGSEKEWAEVLDAGYIDLVDSPFRAGPVLPVLENAINCYKTRRWYNELADRTTAMNELN